MSGLSAAARTEDVKAMMAMMRGLNCILISEKCKLSWRERKVVKVKGRESYVMG